MKGMETMSETIGKLAVALSKAQSMMPGAKADSENPYFKSKYADLASVWEACREPLGDNKLAVVQTLGGASDAVEIITTLIHESGEWIRGTVVLRPVKSDPQGVGSAITYGRRYGITAILGIIQEDDDGNAACRPKEARKPDKTPQKHTETPDKPVTPRNPMPYLSGDDTPENEPETPDNELQIPPSIIEKVKDMTPREAFGEVTNYAIQGQGHLLRKLVVAYCPEYYECKMESWQIPESAIIVILKITTGLKFKKTEKTPKCNGANCDAKITEPEAEHHDGKCMGCFDGEKEA